VWARQLLNHDLSKHVLDVLRETRCDPLQLELEVTESFLMPNIDATALDERRNVDYLVCPMPADECTGMLRRVWAQATKAA